MTIETITLCGCGKPLHYRDADVESLVRHLVAAHGETVIVKVHRQPFSYRVPRHYIALHGLRAQELQRLAMRYGWEQV